MAVRTKQLWAGPGPVSGTIVYTVPVGFRTIVKELGVTHVGNTSTTRFYIKRAGATIGILFFEVLASSVVVVRPRWTVLEAGDGLQFLTDAGTPATVFSVISGTELAL